MNELIKIDSRLGSYLDRSRINTITNTGVTISKARKGRAMFFDKSSYLETTLVELSTADKWTIEVWLNNFNTDESSHILSNDAGGGSGASRIYYSFIEGIKFATTDGTTMTSSIFLDTMKDYSLIVSCNGNHVISLYLNGVLVYSDDLLSLKYFYINYVGKERGNATSIGKWFGLIYKYVIHNHESNLKFIQERYNEFRKSSNVSSSLTLRQRVQHKPVSKEPSLDLFHNYENGNSIDLTSNSNNGTDTAVDYGVDGVRFNGSNAKIQTSLDNSGKTIFSFEALIKKSDATHRIEFGNYDDVNTRAAIAYTDTGILYFFISDVEASSSYIDLSNTTEELFITAVFNGSLENTERAKVFINGEEKTLSRAFTVPESLPSFSEGLALGYTVFGSSYREGLIKFFKQYNTARTLAEHQAEYNRYAKQVVFNEDMTNQNADEITYTVGEFIGEWRVVSGSFKCSETATAKSIECVTDGSISYSGIDLSMHTGNGYIAGMTTSGIASDEGSTVDDATNVSFAGNTITISNFTTGDKISNIKISKGVV